VKVEPFQVYCVPFQHMVAELLFVEPLSASQSFQLIQFAPLFPVAPTFTSLLNGMIEM